MNIEEPSRGSTMDRCEEIQGMIAASLYDEIGDAERETLRGHLAQCEQCRHEAESLENFVPLIPTTRPALDLDLSLLLRKRIDRKTKAWWRHPALAAAACVLAVVGVTAAMWIRGEAPPGNESKVSLIAERSAVGTAIDEAAALVARRNFAGAYIVLSDSVARAPRDPMAGEAQLRLAHLAYSELHWYPEAHRAYEALAESFAEVYRKDAESHRRREILAEAEPLDYASLYGLDAARRENVEGFEAYEKLLARYPGTYIASIAATDMARLIQDTDALEADDNTVAAALEHAISRCEHPIAVAQLKVELAHLYGGTLNGAEKARALYKEVLESDHVVLAQIARDSLSDLGGAESR